MRISCALSWLEDRPGRKDVSDFDMGEVVLPCLPSAAAGFSFLFPREAGLGRWQT